MCLSEKELPENRDTFKVKEGHKIKFDSQFLSFLEESLVGGKKKQINWLLFSQRKKTKQNTPQPPIFLTYIKNFPSKVTTEMAVI